jgi:DNA-directed RNA polymerase subunit omega
MIYPSADKLEDRGSKYALVVLAAKRAKQIKSGVQPLINTDSKNPLTIALEEIAAGKITCEVPDTDIIAPVAEEPEVAQLLAIPEKAEEEGEVELSAVEEETTLAMDEKVSAEDFDEIEEDEEEEETDLLGLGEGEEDRPVVEQNLGDDLGLDEKPKSKRKSKTDIDFDVDIDSIGEDGEETAVNEEENQED